jgi:ribosome biogenesis GTPase A
MVCAVAAQPGHTKELQSVQLERGLRIVDSPGIIFEDDDSIQGQKESSVLLRNVVKPEDVDDPISVGGCASFLLFSLSAVPSRLPRKHSHAQIPRRARPLQI